MEFVKINIPEGYKLEKEGNTYTVVKKPFELEVGKDYKQGDRITVIDRKGNTNNLGFYHNYGFDRFIDCETSELWKEATQKEVVEAFKKECVRKFGENWRSIKLDRDLAGVSSDWLNKGKLSVSIDKTDKGWVVWNINGCLYFDGKWAEKLEESNFATKLDDIERLYYLDDCGIVKIDELQDINHVPTYKLAKGQLVLSQLLSFRHDVWEKEGKPQVGIEGHGISYDYCKNEFIVEEGGGVFRFKEAETALWFLETHKELLNEYYINIIK